jgi:outer membrane protein assembly factor BamB
VGLGYAGPAVAGGKVYVMDYEKRSGKIRNDPGSRVVLDGMERVLCLSAATGELLWKYEYERPYSLSYPSGPRATPTVADGKVYAFGAEGTLSCLDAESGSLLWTVDIKKEYKAKTPIWGFAAHPLVDGDTLYCLAGGEGSVAVALDKNTGAEKWRALSAPEPGYCPPTMIEHGGTRQLLIWHPESLNSLDPATGDVYWSFPLKPAYSMSIAAPRLDGDHLFTGGMGRVGVLLKLTGANPPAVEEVWRGLPKTAVYSVNSTPFFEGGMIYGCDGDTSAFIAARAEDGERLWTTTEPTLAPGHKGRHGTAFIVKHEGQERFFLFSETGDLILAKLSPEGYEEISRQNILKPTNEVFGRPCVWSHPAFAEKCVFARSDEELVCISLAAKN